MFRYSCLGKSLSTNKFKALNPNSTFNIEGTGLDKVFCPCTVLKIVLFIFSLDHFHTHDSFAIVKSSIYCIYLITCRPQLNTPGERKSINKHHPQINVTPNQKHVPFSQVLQERNKYTLHLGNLNHPWKFTFLYDNVLKIKLVLQNFRNVHFCC